MAATFDSLPLCEPIQRSLKECGYQTPSPIQHQTIPHVLGGRDVIGCAQTGTGKTAAFALPILERLSASHRKTECRSPRALVISPTRELASQIQDSFQRYGKYLGFTSTVIFGGVGQHSQVKALRRRPEIVVATPGRLLDLLQQGEISLRRLEVFVIDEADRMLDMGFIHDVRRIIAALPEKRQSLFFSATMPKAIQDLAGTILKDPKQVEVAPPATTVDKIEQRICHVQASQKPRMLNHLLGDRKEGLSLVFCATKRGANGVAQRLTAAGLPAAAIHGNKSQNARERALEDFRRGRIRILVATDIAARGIDVKGIDLVVNYDLPREPESYVHRIGRTARAGASGQAVSLCDEHSESLLLQIERTIRMSIVVDAQHPFHHSDKKPPLKTRPAKGRGRSGTGTGTGGGRRPRSRSRGRNKRAA